MTNFIKDIHNEKIVQHCSPTSTFATFKMLGFEEYYGYDMGSLPRYHLIGFYLMEYNKKYYSLSTNHRGFFSNSYDLALEPVDRGYIYYRLKKGNTGKWKTQKKGSKDLFLNGVYDMPLPVPMMLRTPQVDGVFKPIHRNFLELKRGIYNNSSILYERV